LPEEDGEPETPMLVQCRIIDDEWGDDGDFLSDEFRREFVLLEDCRIRPPIRAIELRDHESTVLQS
jgi:hypothetical protein